MHLSWLLSLLCWLLVPALAFAETFGISQTGGGSGASCASPQSVAFFNTSGNWANPKQSGKIGPGDTVLLCSTITGSLTLQNSGSSGSPITIDGTSATLGTSMGFNTNNKSWWIIQHVVWTTGANTTPIVVSGGSNGIIDDARADGVNAGVIVTFSQFTGTVRPDTMVLKNSFLRTGNTDYGDTEHDVVTTEGSTNVIVEGNYFEMRAGGTGASAHDDCLQTFEKGGTSAGPPGNWTMRYNYFVMNSAVQNDRSWMILESLTGTINIYGNVFVGIQGANSANGLGVSGNAAGIVFNVYDNTFVAKSGSTNNLLNFVAPGTLNLRNNIIYAPSQVTLTGSMTVSRSFNHWFGSSIPSCAGETGSLCGTDPLFTDFTNNVFSLQSGSPDRGAGTNLGSPYNTGIAYGATWPAPATVARPSTWDRGAYQFVAAASAPPTVSITAPNAGNDVTVSTTPLTTLAGSASDDVGVLSVTWACPTCTPISGTATCASCGAAGTSVTWSVASIGLASGANVITATANDADTQTATDAITVTYTPLTSAPAVLRLVK